MYAGWRERLERKQAGMRCDGLGRRVLFGPTRKPVTSKRKPHVYIGGVCSKCSYVRGKRWQPCVA